LIFPLIFCTFSNSPHLPAADGGRYKTEEGGLSRPFKDSGTRITKQARTKPKKAA